MNHPAKRRRLSSVPRPYADGDIAYSDDDNDQLHPEIRDRTAIRNRFKSALEGIFEKYGRDFTGIGDEIDLRTGEVVVDNGHIMRMEDEGDAGGDPTLSEDDSIIEEELEESEIEATDADALKQLEAPMVNNRTSEQRGKGQALESLNLDRIVNKLSQSSQSRSVSLVAKAKDPRWQIPDLPESAFAGTEESESEDTYDSGAGEVSDVAIPRFKSPKKSLWRDARYTRICKRAPTQQRRGRRRKAPMPMWDDALGSYGGNVLQPPGNARNQQLAANRVSYDQYYDSEERNQPLSIEGVAKKTVQGRTVAQAKMHSSDTEKEWSISEEQQLIRYRLNTPLSFAALEVKFPGRNADMLRDRWQHIKRKLLQVPTMTETSTNTNVNGPTTKAHYEHQRTTDRQGQGQRNSQVGRHAIGASDGTRKEESISATKIGASNLRHIHQPDLDTNVNSEIISEESAIEEMVARYSMPVNHADEGENNPSATLDLHNVPLEDMWKVFPAIGQLPSFSDEPNQEHQNQGEFGFDMASWQHPIWTNQSSQDVSVPFSVSHELLEHIDPLLQVQGNISVLPIDEMVQAEEPFDSDTGVKEMDDLETTRLDMLGAKEIGMESTTVDSPVDFATVASDALAQDTIYTPESLRSFMQNTRDLILPDTEKVDQWVTHYDQEQHGIPPYFGSASNTEMTKPSQKSTIPNTTQDDSSMLFLKSSIHPTEHQGAVNEAIEVSSSHMGNSTGVIDMGASKTLQDLTSSRPEALAARSRASSPLSSISSSDPRMARPSELSSSVSNNGLRSINLPEIASETIDPAILIKTPMEIPLKEVQIDLFTLAPEINDNQNAIKPKSPLQSTDPTQQTGTIPGITKKLDENDKLPDSSLDKPKQIPSTRTSVGLKIDMGFADDTMQMLNDSLAQSCMLLETAAKQHTTNKPPMANKVHAFRQRHSAQRSLDIMPQSKTPRSHTQATDNSKVTSRMDAQQIRESAESLWNAFNELNQVTTQDTKQQRLGSLRKKDTAVDRHNNSKQQQPFAKVSTKKPQHVPQRHRETTPIDTYRYMLADPWPEDPLPKDRIPGMRNVPDSQTQLSSPKDPSKSAGRSQAQASILSSNPASPAPRTVELDVDQGPKTKKHQGLVDTQSSGQFVQSRQDTPKIVGDSKAQRTANQDRPKIETSKPLEPLPDDSSLFEYESQSRRSKSSKHIAQGKSTKTRKAGPSVCKHDDTSLPVELPGNLAVDESAPSPRNPSPTIKSADLLLEYGKGRPLTRANLLSQDEVPSTSQDTVLSFLNSQATQLSRPTSTPKSSLLARQGGPQSASSSHICGVNGFRCGRRLCFKCTSRTATQEEVEF